MHVKITKTFILHKIKIKFENHIDMNSLFYTNLLFKKNPSKHERKNTMNISKTVLSNFLMQYLLFTYFAHIFKVQYFFKKNFTLPIDKILKK